MAIEKLPSVGAVTSADLLALWSASLGADAKASLAVVLVWLQSQLTSSGATVTQYAAPNATGFTVLIAPVTTGGSVFLLLTPTAGFAAGTITLPLQTSCVDGQQVVFTTTQAVTTLTVAGNGAIAVNGAPTTLAANAFFRLRYDAPSKSWFRIG